MSTFCHVQSRVGSLVKQICQFNLRGLPLDMTVGMLVLDVARRLIILPGRGLGLTLHLLLGFEGLKLSLLRCEFYFWSRCGGSRIYRGKSSQQARVLCLPLDSLWSG